MAERAGKRLGGRWLGVAVVVALLALVEAGVRLGAVNAALVPPPTEVAVRIADIIATGAFVEPLAATLYLLFIAYIGASALAVGLGLLMGRFPAIYNLFEPLIELLRPLPKPALLPPLILFLGLGDVMKSVVVGLAVLFPVLINTIQGVRGVDPVLIDTARTFGYGRLAVLRKVILPAALPLIFAGLRVSLALGLILVVIAEMLAGTGGLGYLILDMQRTFRVQNMYAWLAILAVLGYGLNAGFLALEHRIIHWAAARPD
jgi:ABC-type nitrate/sulfonate/bicarbonate transport system permease component